MAINKQYPIDIYYPRIKSNPRGWLEKLRAWYWACRVQLEIQIEAYRIRRIVSNDRNMEQRRKRKIENEIRRADNIKKSSLRREMRFIERAILDRLTSLEFAHWSPRPERRGRYRVSRIKIAQRVATPARVFLRVNTARLPRGRGITTANLMEQEVLDELSLACGAPVSYFRHYEHGFWFVIDLGGKLSAIPSIVERRDAVGKMPIQHGVLDVPVGIGAYNKFYHVDFEEAPHAIVAGATGFGKSVFIHNILTYIIENTKPSQVLLALADLKGGAELGRYEGVPHLWTVKRQFDTIATGEQRVYSKREEVLDMLKDILYEVESRLQMFAREKVSKLASWNNKHHSRSMPRVLVVVDEIQNAMLDPKTRGEIEAILVDIASRARATGIHVIIATQRPSVDVITGLIKANFPTRIAFNCFSIHDSKTILDTTEAANLGRPGLLVLRGLGNRSFRCQSPYLPEGIISEIIDNATEGRGAKVETRNVGIPDLVGWAIDSNDGTFTIDAMYNAFRGQGITYAECRKVWGDVTTRKETRHNDKIYRYIKRSGKLVEIDETGAQVGKATIETMARWAIENCDGNFSYRAVCGKFGREMTVNHIKEIVSSHEGKTVTIDGVVYTLMPGDGGRKPRKWVAVV